MKPWYGEAGEPMKAKVRHGKIFRRGDRYEKADFRKGFRHLYKPPPQQREER